MWDSKIFLEMRFTTEINHLTTYFLAWYNWTPDLLLPSSSISEWKREDGLLISAVRD